MRNNEPVSKHEQYNSDEISGRNLMPECWPSRISIPSRRTTPNTPSLYSSKERVPEFLLLTRAHKTKALIAVHSLEDTYGNALTGSIEVVRISISLHVYKKIYLVNGSFILA